MAFPDGILPAANQNTNLRLESTDDDKSMSLVAGVVMGVLLILLFLLMATLVLVHRKQGRHSTKTGEQSGHIPSTSASSQCHDPTFVEASSSPPPSSPSQDQMISPRIASPFQEPCRTTSPVPSYNRRVSPENGNLPVTCNREIFFAPHQRPLLYHTRSQILQNDVDEYLPETSMDSVRAVLAVPYTDRKERFSPLQYRRQTLPSHPLLSPRYMSKSVPHSLFDPWGPDGSLNRRELRARNTSGQIRSSKFQKVAAHVTPEGYAAQGDPQASSASPQSKQQNRDEVTVVPASMGRSPSSLKIDPLGEPSLMIRAIKNRDSFHLLEYPNTPKLVPRMGSKVQLVNALAKDDLEVEIKKGYSNEDDNATARSRLIVRPLVGGEHLDTRRAQPYGEFHQRENATMPSSCLRGQDGLKSSFSASTTSDGRAKLSHSGDSRPSLTTRPQGSATQRESRV